jgi:hypothetical protein
VKVPTREATPIEQIDQALAIETKMLRMERHAPSRFGDGPTACMARIDALLERRTLATQSNEPKGQ